MRCAAPAERARDDDDSDGTDDESDADAHEQVLAAVGEFGVGYAAIPTS